MDSHLQEHPVYRHLQSHLTRLFGEPVQLRGSGEQWLGGTFKLFYCWVGTLPFTKFEATYGGNVSERYYAEGPDEPLPDIAWIEKNGSPWDF